MRLEGNNTMANVVEVRFREVGKIYSFAPGEAEFKRGDHGRQQPEKTILHNDRNCLRVRKTAHR